MNGICPNCGKSDYVPDPREQGANRCNRCGHVAMVRDWHERPATSAPAIHLRAQEYTGRELENHVPAVRRSTFAPTTTPEPGAHFWWQE